VAADYNQWRNSVLERLNPDQQMRMTKQTSYSAAAALVLLGLANPTEAQISLTPGDLSYSQNFNELTRSTTAETWSNNADTVSANDSPRLIGLQGWYVGSFGNTTTTPLIRAGTGSSTTGSFYSFGSSGAEDRALGTMPTDASASASMRLGVRFVNDTGDILSGFTFSYDGEQWRKAQLTTPQNNQFVTAYAIFGAGLGSLDSVNYSAAIAGATFNTPVDGGDNVGSALDGNDAANRLAALGATVTDLVVMPGEEVWLRWFDSNSSGADHGIAIDNFEISFTTMPVPEPSTAAVFGLAALLLVKRIRRTT
jgi:hypothetical protein